MSIKMTILGTGQIGASIGMALAEYGKEIDRVGHDRDPLFAREAKTKNAVDKVALNIHNAVEGADVVVLALPLSDVKEVLQQIAPDLREDVVILDTCATRRACEDWAQEYLPPGRYYVGFTPILNPDVLHVLEGGVKGASAELFKDGYFAISVSPRVPSEAIELATSLTGYLGAKPFFAEIGEVDAFMMAVHTLPQTLSAVLINTTVENPGWDDVRRFAGRPFAQTSAPIANTDTPEALAEAVLANQDTFLRMLDGITQTLDEIRDAVEAGNLKVLSDSFKLARKEHDRWFSDRQTGDWEKARRPDIDDEDALNLAQRFFGLRRRVKDKDGKQE